MTTSINPYIGGTLDTTAIMIALGTVADLLPPIAASFSIVWLLLRIVLLGIAIYQTPTMQRWIRCTQEKEIPDDFH